MAVNVIKWFETALLPQLNEMKGEMKALGTKIDEMDKRFTSEFKSVRNSIDELDKRLTSEIRSTRDQLKTEIESVREQFNAVERIVRLEEKIKELEAKH